MVVFCKSVSLGELVGSVPDIKFVKNSDKIACASGVAALHELSKREEARGMLGFVVERFDQLQLINQASLIVPPSLAINKKFFKRMRERGNILLVSSNPRLAIIRILQIVVGTLKTQEQVVEGKNCRIKSGAILGEEGFGFERDEQGRPIRFPHFGRVVLGDEVEVGANTVVSRGALSDTTIGAYTKIDDLVYIAHNCQIGERVLIAGGAKLCGGVIVGNDVWIGAGACVKQNIRIGEGAVIGMGAIVTRDVPAFATVVGNPARVLEQTN